MFFFYRCLAQNVYSLKKPQRQYSISVHVISSSSKLNSSLLPPLQDQRIYVEPGKKLRLLCAGYSGSVKWSFIPRGKKNSIRLDNAGTEIQYESVRNTTHDGIYNCSTSTDFQVRIFLG